MLIVTAETAKYTKHCNFDVSKLQSDAQEEIIREGMAMANKDFTVRVNGQSLRYPSVQAATKAMQMSADWAGQPINYTLVVLGEEFEMVTE
jgi:hypothetical protein